MGRHILERHIRDARADDLGALKAAQIHFAKQVITQDQFSDHKTVAGVDVAYRGERYCAAIRVLGRHDLTEVEALDVVGQVTGQDIGQITGKGAFPYVSGLLAYREMPAVLDVFEQMGALPDIVIFDGNGHLHPRQCGAARYLGLVLDIPVIGVSKNPPFRDYIASFEFKRGNFEPLSGSDIGPNIGPDIGQGLALCTQDKVKPIFVSIGHKVSLDTAKDIVMELSRYRVPEPIRVADQACRQGLRRDVC